MYTNKVVYVLNQKDPASFQIQNIFSLSHSASLSINYLDNLGPVWNFWALNLGITVLANEDK